ncbi:hypothetical protein I3900191A7_14510 [Clostridium baratii]|uniref:hypothetical protein n=1 Tax=Clostridium baratii TaxID=1561 RepID=UPI0036F2DE51
MQDMNKIVEKYIRQCEEIIKQNDVAKARKMQEIIISALKCEIIDIDENLDEGFFSISGSGRDPNYIENIEKINSRLEVFLAQLSKIKKQDEDKSISILLNNNNNNNNTNNNINNNMDLIFKKVKEEIENNEFMSEEEIKEVLEKISEIEAISKSDEAKNKKWFKLRPTMEWLGTKGVSVATAILGLITAILKMK